MNTPQVVFVQLYTFYQSHSSPTSRQSLSCPDPPDQSPLYHTIPSSPQYFPALNFSFEYTETLFSSPSLQSLAQLPQKYPFSSLSFSCEPNNKPSPESWAVTITLWIQGKKTLRWWSKIGPPVLSILESLKNTRSNPRIPLFIYHHWAMNIW